MRTLVALLAVLAIGASSGGRARAYERATVTGDPTTPLAWPRRELGVRIASDTSRDLAAVDVSDAIRRSLTTWTRAGGCTDVALLDLGAPADLRTNLLGGSPDGENRVVFREDGWPPDLGPETLAITTLVYRRSTGEILDADIDLNALDHAWSVSATPPLEATDLENTITHELGHLLGFAHVSDPDATMFASSDVGDVVKRDLAADDVTGVCEVYPAARRTPGGVGPRPPLTSGCAISSGRGAGVIPALLAALALIGSSVRRRRRS
ncbi:matrixin family metalloprotease [Sandaracinus amylolyticus]|uniref:matrixin family metalloprotease n=1 Tax=Sandaracinus amylolyticus TaxID=927083 RepID=UPI001F1EA940|nr:matrixin family metalloprotease [Sandaracinus amylolyticus]UJR82657.1 Hypothetical protein I5071_47220 [Sandaracinus amylolyticus]